MGNTDQEESALLVAQNGPLNGQRWPLTNTILIGRDTTCDIVVPDRQVSRHHIELTIQPEGIFIKDMGSKNGTHLNGKLLEAPARLQDGDIIQIALAQQFVFLSSDATLPLDIHPSKAQMEYSPALSDQQQPLPEKNSLLTIGRLRLEKRSRRVWITVPTSTLSTTSPSGQYQEVEIDPPLSASQFRMLELLYDQQGRVVSRRDLISGVWETDEAIGVSEQALDALVRRLRDRIAAIDPAFNYIVTVRGHGLRLDNPPISS